MCVHKCGWWLNWYRMIPNPTTTPTHPTYTHSQTYERNDCYYMMKLTMDNYINWTLVRWLVMWHLSPLCHHASWSSLTCFQCKILFWSDLQIVWHAFRQLPSRLAVAADSAVRIQGNQPWEFRRAAQQPMNTDWRGNKLQVEQTCIHCMQHTIRVHISGY